MSNTIEENNKHKQDVSKQRNKQNITIIHKHITNTNNKHNTNKTLESILKRNATTRKQNTTKKTHTRNIIPTTSREINNHTTPNTNTQTQHKVKHTQNKNTTQIIKINNTKDMSSQKTTRTNRCKLKIAKHKCF